MASSGTDQRVSLELVDLETARQDLRVVWTKWIEPQIRRGQHLIFELRLCKHSDRQRRLVWSIMTDLSKQLDWGPQKLRFTPHGWANFITASLDGQDMVPDMNGTGLVSVGRSKSISEMTRAELSLVIDAAQAFGTNHGVRWSPTSLGR